MELVAFVGEDRESWGQILGVINHIEAERVILVVNKKIVDFPEIDGSEKLYFDSSMPLADLKEEMKNRLKEKLSGDFEVALSIASGNGKEHMALISALLNIPVGIKIAVFTKGGINYLS